MNNEIITEKLDLILKLLSLDRGPFNHPTLLAYYTRISNYTWQEKKQLKNLFWKNYPEYRKTAHYKSLRLAASGFYGERCCMCGREDIVINMHHNSYKNVGEESITEVTMVCLECHQNHHGIITEDKNLREDKTTVINLLNDFKS